MATSNRDMSEVTTKLLGKILDDNAKMDAIHIAVAPVVVEQHLLPGEHVGLSDAGEAIMPSTFFPAIGIIDPFLTEAVQPGQRCFIFLYPGTITSLRHEWTHPAFEPVP